MSALYNPAKDGFPAKAWECLRRNQAFWNDVHCVGAESEEDATDMAIELRSQMETHPFYRSVYGPLVEWPHYGHDGDREGLFYIARRLDFEMPWPSIHKETQGWIENSLYPQSASIVETPPTGEFDPYSRHYEEAKARGLLSDLSQWLLTHRVIVLPQITWDRPHKDRILAELEKFIGEPLAKDARWLKNTGRVLGTDADWRAYLLFEQWRDDLKRDFSRDLAINLVAQEIYSKGEITFGVGSEQRVKSAKHDIKGKSSLHAQCYRVRQNVSRIEKAIESVYPVFNPIEVTFVNRW